MFLATPRSVPSYSQGVSDDPVLAKVATTVPTRDFDSPANHFPKRVPYQLPAQAKHPPQQKKKGRDSSRDVKEVHRSSIVVEESRPSYGKPFPPSSTVPRLPSIPRPFVPKPRADYAHLPQMHQRSADGKIFGGATRRYVPTEYVPYLDPAAVVQTEAGQYDQQCEQYEQQYDQQEYQQEYQQEEEYQEYQVALDAPVGPDNPMKQLSVEWCACWDDEAGAVYYYNQTSGEATWVMPDDLGAAS
jgi:hypothetical protein